MNVIANDSTFRLIDQALELGVNLQEVSAPQCYTCKPGVAHMDVVHCQPACLQIHSEWLNVLASLRQGRQG